MTHRKTRMTNPLWILLVAWAGGVTGCDRDPSTPSDGFTPQFAKPAPPPGTGPSVAVINDAAADASPTDLRSDGRGPYTDGVCGVAANISVNSTAGVRQANLMPAHSSNIPASCGGPRSATVTLATRHISDDPHVDDASNPVGTVALHSLHALENGSGIVNAPPCFNTGKGKNAGGLGLRFNAANYPGSDHLQVVESAPGVWHVSTKPYPDNVGYCLSNNTVSFWHVILDVNFSPK